MKNTECSNSKSSTQIEEEEESKKTVTKNELYTKNRETSTSFMFLNIIFLSHTQNRSVILQQCNKQYTQEQEIFWTRQIGIRNGQRFR